MESVGLHLRLAETFHEAVEQAQLHNLSLFQCFFRLQSTGMPLQLDDSEIRHFVTTQRDRFKQLILHGSYTINLSGVRRASHRQLREELTLARRLAFTHMVLHPGSAKGARTREDAIDALARAVNAVTTYEQEITLLLENVAFGNQLIGGDLNDFNRLLQKVDFPDRVAFCLDTSHAHAFGYRLITAEEQDAFIAHVDTLLGVKRIGLLHLNDTHEACGSRKDHHAILGEGLFGADALSRFITHPLLQEIPVILELPVLPVQQVGAILKQVQSWRSYENVYAVKESVLVSSR